MKYSLVLLIMEIFYLKICLCSRNTYNTNHHDNLTMSVCLTTSILIHTRVLCECVLYIDGIFVVRIRPMVERVFFMIKLKRHTFLVNLITCIVAVFQRAVT